MKIYVFLMGLIALFLTVLGGMFLALPFGLLSLMGAVPLAVLLRKWQDVAELKRYAEQIENIYITSDWEQDDTVLARAEYAEQMLLKANNRQKVKVYKIYFGAGEFINESWEEYLERVDLFIQEDRKTRHTELVKSGALYEKYWLKQRKMMEG